MVLRRSLIILIAVLLPASALATEKYTVKKGDNLYDLSRKFGLTVDELKSINKLKDNRLDIGDVLIIGVSVNGEDTTAKNIARSNNNEYTVKNGDTLGEIAETYGLSSEDLKEANDLKNTKLQIGQKLLIPSSNSDPVKVSEPHKPVTADAGSGKTGKVQDSPKIAPAETSGYAVQKGDTLGHIAVMYNASTADIKKTNGLKNDRLQIGQVLRIPGKIKSETEAVHADATITPDKPAPVNAGVYTVVKGDTPGGIARKLGVGTDELIKLNNLDSRKLQVGQKLTVPGYTPQQNENIVNKQEAVSSGQESAEPDRTETVEVPAPSETRSREYVIRKGDTPGAIAKRLGVSTDELIKLNNLDSRKLRIGQVLVVPGMGTDNDKGTLAANNDKGDPAPDKKDAQNNAPSEYIVKKGDTLYVLSKTFGVSVERIKKYNNLKNSNLRIGQRLVLNTSGTTVAAGETVQKEPAAETVSVTETTETVKYSREYTVRRGDTLGHLALKFGVSQSELKKANGLKNSNLRSGQVLIVPGTEVTVETEEEVVIKESVIKEPAPEHASEVYIKKRYVVKPGDTLGNIAKSFGVTVEEIKKASALKKDTINNGDILLIPVPQEKVTQSKYTVARGDTLSKIGKKFGIPVSAIMKANGLSSDTLRAGMRLSIPGLSSAGSGESETESVAASSLPRGEYVVKKGDTLGRIARRYDVTIKALKRENNIKGNSIRAGQVLYIPGYERQETEYRVVTEKPAIHESNGQYNYTDPEVENGRFSKESIIQVAKKYLGAPYKFGGNDLATGIDCSGYVKKIFSRFNVYLPRTARDIYYSSGFKVSKKKLDTGDLVFFTTYAKYPSHVGIYIGNDEFIHASSASRKVTIDSINKQYYKKRYIGAKRVQLSGLFYDELSKDYAGFSN
ncbi:MAG TPA: LysM peptidoglycan-binding domain-containing protein [Thermodesulfobacteriota bacterium]|nr:LysM peptidoglycan-binding domain-containing protein [Thermodesulfobacteriota bacterium]